MIFTLLRENFDWTRFLSTFTSSKLTSLFDHKQETTLPLLFTLLPIFFLFFPALYLFFQTAEVGHCLSFFSFFLLFPSWIVLFHLLQTFSARRAVE